MELKAIPDLYRASLGHDAILTGTAEQQGCVAGAAKLELRNKL